MKNLIILTGPPGSGKTTYAKENLTDLRVYDTDLNNKNGWMRSPVDCILMTAAPSAKNKTYWLEMASLHGFTPKLLVLWLPRMVCYARMKSRSGLSPTERNDLEKSVEQWYKLYSRHPREDRVCS